MAEPKCVKDYFTYNERGDKNCGCKISSETELIIHDYDLADCYVIPNNSSHTTTLEDTTMTTTTCDTTAALMQEDVKVESSQQNGKEFLWTAAGVDAAHASNEFEVFDSPEVGSPVTASQLAEIQVDTLNAEDMVQFGWWSWPKTIAGAIIR